LEENYKKGRRSSPKDKKIKQEKGDVEKNESGKSEEKRVLKGYTKTCTKRQTDKRTNPGITTEPTNKERENTQKS